MKRHADIPSSERIRERVKALLSVDGREDEIEMFLNHFNPIAHMIDDYVGKDEFKASAYQPGDVYPTKRYGDIKILATYPGKGNAREKLCSVQFINTGSTRHKIHTSAVYTGSVRDWWAPIWFGVGYLGEGELNFLTDSGEISDAGSVWAGMLARCYDNKSDAYSSYGAKGINVCNEWHNFQNFAEWFYSQKREKGWHLEKDLKNPENAKQYNPDNCEFVPPAVNNMFQKQNGVSENGLPRGVSAKGDYFRGRVYTYDLEGSKKRVEVYGKDAWDAFYKIKKIKEDNTRERVIHFFEQGWISEKMRDSLLRYTYHPFPEEKEWWEE